MKLMSYYEFYALPQAEKVKWDMVEDYPDTLSMLVRPLASGEEGLDVWHHRNDAEPRTAFYRRRLRQVQRNLSEGFVTAGVARRMSRDLTEALEKSA